MELPWRIGEDLRHPGNALVADPYRRDGRGVGIPDSTVCMEDPLDLLSGTCRRTWVSFTLDCCGHLYLESDAALRDRLDAIYSAGQRG